MSVRRHDSRTRSQDVSCLPTSRCALRSLGRGSQHQQRLAVAATLLEAAPSRPDGGPTIATKGWAIHVGHDRNIWVNGR
jgi:hypothetical protein